MEESSLTAQGSKDLKNDMTKSDDLMMAVTEVVENSAIIKSKDIVDVESALDEEGDDEENDDELDDEDEEDLEYDHKVAGGKKSLEDAPKGSRKRRGVPDGEPTNYQSKKFRYKWLKEDEFALWLSPVVDNPFKSWCKVCKRPLTAGKSELVKHAETRKHKACVAEYLARVEAGGGIEVPPPIDEVPVVEEGVAEAEMKMAAFVAEHDLSESAVEHLNGLVRELCQKPGSAKNVSLGMAKQVMIVNQVFSKAIDQELNNELKRKIFSVMIDETKDSEGRIFSVMVKYFSDSRNRIKTDVFDVVRLTEAEVSAKKLSKMVQEYFSRRLVPFKNIVGLAADFSSIVLEDDNSVKTKVLQNHPKAMIVSCDSYLTYRVAANAMQALPGNLEELVRNIMNYVPLSCSLDELQDAIRVEGNKVPSVAAPVSRLALPHCVGLVLDNVVALELAFMKDAVEHKSDIAKCILAELQNPYTKAYLHFLKYSLSLITNIGCLFSLDHIFAHRIVKECQAHFRVLCEHFMTPAGYSIDDLRAVEPFNEQNVLPHKEIFVGADCQTILSKLEAVDIEFFQHCKTFFQLTANELRVRLPLLDPMMEDVAFLEPDISLSNKERESVPSVATVGLMFPELFDLVELDAQWNLLPNFFSAEDVEDIRKLPLDSMWGVVSEMRQEDEKPVFGHLGRLTKLILSYPFGHVDSDQISRLAIQLQAHPFTIEGFSAQLKLKQFMQQDNLDCTKFRVTGRHLQLYANAMQRKNCGINGDEERVDKAIE